MSIKNITLVAIYPKQLRFLLGSSLQQTSAPPCGALDRFRKFGLGRLAIKTNIMMRRWNHNVILFRGISRFLSAVCRRWFPGQSGDRTCLVLYKRLDICFGRPFQLLPSACTSDIPLTLSWKFFPPPPQSPTCHRLHLLIVLSSLVCHKYLLICRGFLSPPFLKRC